ncbi:MAG: FtsX-like permease family protein [Bacteroidia bacterium]|jgi:putative ABC transport system permease protein|nr:FtsX-like permease family protein [Bacteroidia bacterium]
MKILQLFIIAFRSLNKNKLRSFLTMLGIIIGVASVIAMLAIGQGSKKSIESSISSLGVNTIIVMPGALTSGGVRLATGSANSLKNDDETAIAQRCDLLEYISPVVFKSVQAVSGNQNWSTVIFGVNDDYFKIRALTVSTGVKFSDQDEHVAAKVCVIGYTIDSNLFGSGVNPIGMSIRINSIPFRIIGMYDRKGQNAFGQDQDDAIIAPFSTIQKRMMSGSDYLNSIYCSAKSEALIDDAVDEITTVLRQRHKLAPSDDNDFTVRTLEDIANIFGTVTRVMTLLLASVAGISLIVGGIGIMNIMLVSVTERTREIGIRLAIGAKGKDILLQFMIESVLISFIGGFLGVCLGVFASYMVGKFGGWPVTVTPFSIILSFAFSAIVGIFFGWYPARKAASLNPIDALRYE